MNKKTAIVSVVVFILIIAGMFGYAHLKQSQIAETEPEETTEPQIDPRYSYIDRVDAKHFYIDGVHTFVGEIPMPTPCDLLYAEAFVAESYPEQVSVNFTVVNNAEMCAEVITPQRFSVTATASDQATFSANFMGQPIEFNIIEAEPGETPESFELYIKG